MSDGDLREIPHLPDLPHPLGRSILWHDPGNRAFGIRPLLADLARTRPAGPWWARHNYDQRGSSCTTQAMAGLLVSSPFRMLDRPRLARALAELGTEQQRHAFYLASQAYDPWPGGEPRYEGTSTDAPYRLARERGLIREWRWCFGLQDVQDTLEVYSPLTVGTVWLESMFDVDARGYLIVDRSSRQAGGHEWLVLDYDATDDEYLALNSWSRAWGNNGRFRVKGDDFRWLLLEQQGDAATVTL